MGTAVAPHVSGADNSSADLTDEDVSSVDDGDEADDDNDDDDEHYEDAQEVIDSFQSSKRERSPGSSSDSCDDSHRLRKRGKQIGKQLLNLASAPPLPADDDDDATQEPTLNSSNKPDKGVDLISSSQANDFTDYPLTQETPKPKSKTVLSDSQSASSSLEIFLSKKPTRP